jgi:hypothetical protein
LCLFTLCPLTLKLLKLSQPLFNVFTATPFVAKLQQTGTYQKSHAKKDLQRNGNERRCPCGRAEKTG